MRQPSTRAELAQISGVGAMKLERYSAAVLALVGGSDVDSALDLVPAGVPTDRGRFGHGRVTVSRISRISDK